MNSQVNNEQDQLKVELTTKDKHGSYTPISIQIVEVQVERSRRFPTFLPLIVQGAPSTQVEVADNSDTSPLLLTPYTKIS